MPAPPVTLPEHEIVEMAISDLDPAPWNPRSITPEALAGLRASIRRFGLVQLVVWNRRSRQIVGGHQRVTVLKADGVARTKVMVVDLSDIEEKALNLTLNSQAISGTFTDGAVVLIEEVRVADASLHEALRLDEVHDQIVVADDGGDGPPERPVDAGAGAELRRKWPTAPGQVWEIPSKRTAGAVHRIACGDSTDPPTVGLVMDGRKPALMVTDPPYGVEYDPGWRDQRRSGERGGNALRARTAVVANDDRVDWSESYGLSGADVAFVWSAMMKCEAVLASLRAADYHARQGGVWVKQMHAIGRALYQWKHEIWWLAVKPGAKIPWFGGRDETTVWEIQALIGFQRNREGAFDHSAQKPIECYAKPIRLHVPPGGLVYDPFAGIGPILLAAEQEGRVAAAIELEPKWVATALERMALLGLEPRLVHGELARAEDVEEQIAIEAAANRAAQARRRPGAQDSDGEDPSDHPGPQGDAGSSSDGSGAEEQLLRDADGRPTEPPF